MCTRGRRSASISEGFTRAWRAPTQNERTRPSEVVRTEARALLELAIRLDGPMAVPFARAAELVVEAAGRGNRVIVLGMGKSGLIARKIAATLCSTGTAAHFLHPAEALHGDLGMVAAGDVVVALSASGETEELLALLPVLERLGMQSDQPVRGGGVDAGAGERGFAGCERGSRGGRAECWRRRRRLR